jgi:hypothetical protein
MLNKTICQKCYKEYFHADTLALFDLRWTTFGFAICRVWPIYITNDPPEKCPYLLEQTLTERKNVNAE